MLFAITMHYYYAPLSPIDLKKWHQRLAMLLAFGVVIIVEIWNVTRNMCISLKVCLLHIAGLSKGKGYLEWNMRQWIHKYYKGKNPPVFENIEYRIELYV